MVKSTEASGPFTGAALKALLAFLRSGLLDLEDGASIRARERQVRGWVGGWVEEGTVLTGGAVCAHSTRAREEFASR